MLKSSQDEVDNLFFSPRSSFAPPHPRGPVGKCWMAGVLQRGEVPSHIHHKSTCRDYFVKRHLYSVTTIITAIFSSSEFHDLPLTWENGAEVPTWLSGTYVR